MKAVILAAGKGLRMLPLTRDKPKTLIEINGKPFLSYLLDHLHKAGITEVAIVAGYKIEKIAEFAKKHSAVITLIEQQQLRGTGDALMQAKDFVDGEDFMVLGGDNLFSPADLQAIQKDDEYCYVGGWKTANPEKYGIMVCKGNVLLKIVEKPRNFIGDLINAGLYKFTPDIFEALGKIGLSERGELELTDAVSLLAESRKVKVLMLQDYWLDLGRKEDVPEVEAFLKKLGE